MKLGSLFDGSGGFPLAGSICGVKPAWAAEIEPYPIAVTRLRFPDMKHLGNVCKVHGTDIEPVDIITFGSPCQDMSIAGRRAGLKHADNGDDETTRSGLFMEAVRIIKEMREKTNGAYPRYAIWENVCGAFSSNGGKDFRLALQKIIGIVEPKAVMPEVPRGGGRTQTVMSETDGALLTEFLMLNTGESPNAAAESTLSQILEADVPEKYYLSEKACIGILRRAEKRGKELPKMLKEALIRTMEKYQQPIS